VYFMLTPVSMYRLSVLEGCVVCGERDERALSTLKLGDGARVVVCGSHDLIYRRSGEVAQDVEQLRVITRDRRERTLRRDGGDELGAQLVAAFSNDRRASNDRRR
jgi:hypothetical protein